MSQVVNRVDVRLARKLILLIQAWITPASPLAAYLVSRVLGLQGEQISWAVTRVFPPVVLLIGLVYPYVSIRVILARALRGVPGEAPGDRLRRLLQAPWRIILVSVILPWGLGGAAFSLPVCLWFHKSPWLVAAGALVATCFGLLVSFPLALSVERRLLPFAIEEQARHPSVAVRRGGFTWPRQAWFLPYAFMVALFSLIVLSGTVVTVKTMEVQQDYVARFLEAGDPEGAARLQGLTRSILSEFQLPLLGVAVLVFLLPALTGWLLARRQERGARAVLAAIEGLSSGQLRAPAWVSTDEVGDLATGLMRVLAQLQRIPETLQESANQLVLAGSTLSAANDSQHEGLTRQAAALQEANVTAQEIQQTSAMAAHKTEKALVVAQRAEQLGERGAQAIEQTLRGFADMRACVLSIREKVLHLEQSAERIDSIVAVVRDLADQSNLLAVNAAIEAASSGEQGRGFGVVAREIRHLADQSLQATRDIRAILEETVQAIRATVQMSDNGMQRAERGARELDDSGRNLHELSGMVRDQSATLRQIAAVVQQQNSGVSQISQAVQELSQLMDETVRRLESTQEASASLLRVSAQVDQLARQYTRG